VQESREDADFSFGENSFSAFAFFFILEDFSDVDEDLLAVTGGETETSGALCLRFFGVTDLFLCDDLPLFLGWRRS